MIKTNVFFDFTFRYEKRALTLNKEKATLVKDNQALVKDMNTLQEECTRLKTTMVRVGPLSVPSVWMFLCCVGDFPLTTMVLCRCFYFVLESSL
jgi:hypothetical protein